MTWADDSPTILSISPKDPVHLRQKRTLLLKKKILGAGIIGLGLGVGVGALKGYKYGHYSRPYSYHSPIIIERPTYYPKPYYIDSSPYYSYSNYGHYY
ncbi:hypothetical protein PV325_012486 [Microctonus aethiopoides]|nr:hypothetical protein PV325_012486 [Microctonus aethiopoides]KAK0094155.1 hypothetical protein PV326_011712 [Microctonus aethiopoides]